MHLKGEIALLLIAAVETPCRHEESDRGVCTSADNHAAAWRRLGSEERRRLHFKASKCFPEAHHRI